jgi:hypothetical protein
MLRIFMAGMGNGFGDTFLTLRSGHFWRSFVLYERPVIRWKKREKGIFHDLVTQYDPSYLSLYQVADGEEMIQVTSPYN